MSPWYRLRFKTSSCSVILILELLLKMFFLFSRLYYFLSKYNVDVSFGNKFDEHWRQHSKSALGFSQVSLELFYTTSLLELMVKMELAREILTLQACWNTWLRWNWPRKWPRCYILLMLDRSYQILHLIVFAQIFIDLGCPSYMCDFGCAYMYILRYVFLVNVSPHLYLQLILQLLLMMFPF